MDSFTSEDDCLIHRVNVWETQWDVHKQHFLAGRQSDVHCKLSWKHLNDCPLSQTHGRLKVNLASRARLFLSLYVFLIHLRRRSRWCQAQTKVERSAHAYKCEGWTCIFSQRPPFTLPFPHLSQTAPIKACVISVLAAMKSQPGAHLFKRENNEFFVASHLPITINLAFCRYLHGDLYSRASRLPHRTFRHLQTEKFIASHP